MCEDGKSAFFYIPQKQLFENNFVSINPKPIDREKYIDTRRKWMYGSYSLLIVSLIPTFISAGELNNAVKLYNDGVWDYNKAKPYENVFKVFGGISIGCGVLFVFELIRYFYAANSVLPQKAKNVPESKQIIYNKPFENPSVKELENQSKNENDKQNQVDDQSENKVVNENNNNSENINNEIDKNLNEKDDETTIIQ